MNHPRYISHLVLGAGLLISLFALGLYVEATWARRFWIWPQTPPLGLAFVAAVLAGGAAPMIWIGVTRKLSAIRAILLWAIVANLGIAAHLFTKRELPGNDNYLLFSILFAVSGAASVFFWVRSRRIPRDQDSEVPKIVSWAFLIFATILFCVGSPMILDVPGVFPLPLTTDMAAVYGWFFLGSCAYYFHGFLRPSKLNSTGQILSFLVYDLLLIPPYASYLKSVPSEFLLSLCVYLGVLISSALFCAYFLFIHRGREKLQPAEIKSAA